MEAQQAVLHRFGDKRNRAGGTAVHRPDIPAAAGGRSLPAGAQRYTDNTVRGADGGA